MTIITSENIFSTVYLKLEDEFSLYYMPLNARKTANGYYVLPPDVDDSVEDWEFPPGSVVRVEDRQLALGVRSLAVERIL